MTAFHVGQKVVCIDDAEYDKRIISGDIHIFPGMDGLRKGAVYTIREVCIDPVHEVPVVKLAEIKRLPLCRFFDTMYESGFYPERFRPVVERKTDISIFTDMLKTQRVRTPA